MPTSKAQGLVAEAFWGHGPAAATDAEVAEAQRQLKVAQWLLPGLTGGIAVLNAIHGEQQRPFQQVECPARKAVELAGAA